jgi:hypothetical protein
MKYSIIKPSITQHGLYTKQILLPRKHCLENIMEYTEDNESPDFYLEPAFTYKKEGLNNYIPVYKFEYIAKKFLTQKEKEPLYQKQSEERDFFEKSILSNDIQTKYLSLGLLLKNIYLSDLYRIGKLIQFNIYPYNKFKLDLGIKINNKSFSDYMLFDSLCKYHKLLLDKLS